jgi:hypothetical protein
LFHVNPSSSQTANIIEPIQNLKITNEMKLPIPPHQCFVNPNFLPFSATIPIPNHPPSNNQRSNSNNQQYNRRYFHQNSDNNFNHSRGFNHNNRSRGRFRNNKPFRGKFNAKHF